MYDKDEKAGVDFQLAGSGPVLRKDEKTKKAAVRVAWKLDRGVLPFDELI